MNSELEYDKFRWQAADNIATTRQQPDRHDSDIVWTRWIDLRFLFINPFIHPFIYLDISRQQQQQQQLGNSSLPGRASSEPVNEIEREQRQNIIQHNIIYVSSIAYSLQAYWQIEREREFSRCTYWAPPMAVSEKQI